MDFMFLSPYQNDNLNYDEFSENVEDFNYPLNLETSFIFNDKYDFENESFYKNLINDENKENNDNTDNNMSNTINVNKLDINKQKKLMIFTIINNEKNEKTTSSSKNKTSNSSISKENNKLKLGRKRKGEIYNEDNDKVHTKNRPDNIRVKFKRLFFNNLINCFNSQLSESKNPKLKSLCFKKLNTDFIKSLKRDKILKMLDSPASSILSQKIAKKYRMLQGNHNKEIINLIYKENEENIIINLNKLIKELIEAFCGNTNDDLLLKNYRLDDSIKELSKKESKDYIENLKNEAKHFEANFIKIYGRRIKNKKN